MERDDINHRFWECAYSKIFWADFQSYFDHKLRECLDKEIVFLGSEDPLVCTLVFAAKHFIQKSHFREEVPKFRGFLENIFYIQKIEKQISIQKNT